jgi:hypothetical protein
MIPPVSKRPKIAGATFIEALAVTVVIAAVISAMGASFIQGLKSYVGEYSSEARQLEVQRAFAELQYFGGLAARFETDGDTVTFYYADGTSTRFIFQETGMYDGLRLGILSIVLASGQQYQYGVNVLADGSPFNVAKGGCSFLFFVESSGGPVSLLGLVYPSLVL